VGLSAAAEANHAAIINFHKLSGGKLSHLYDLNSIPRILPKSSISPYLGDAIAWKSRITPIVSKHDLRNDDRGRRVEMTTAI
jgi:hypothetical protein